MKRKPMTAAERKRRQRAKDKALGVADTRLSTTEKERELFELMAEYRGYTDKCEYLMALVVADCDTSLNHNFADRDVAGRVAVLQNEKAAGA